ncbi:MAG: hypothetical protein KJ043_16925 [Anaerolineae bacterium]|nr:hypothetical protein [Anaerolineae bacterium]
MTTITLELPEEMAQKLTEKAQADAVDLTTWIYTLLESSVDDEADDDITFSKEEILNDIREGIIDVMNGDYGRPAREFLDELWRENKKYANNK